MTGTEAQSGGLLGRLRRTGESLLAIARNSAGCMSRQLIPRGVDRGSPLVGLFSACWPRVTGENWRDGFRQSWPCGARLGTREQPDDLKRKQK